MPRSDSELENLTSVAIEAARRAARYIQSEAGEQREVKSKEGGSSLASQVVTEVDLESQRLILETLAGSIQDHGLGLLTEEAADDASRFAAERFWCIDPLDGTLPFTENVPGFAVSIALVSRSGEPLIGVVVEPLTGATYHARRGGGAFKDGEKFVIAESGGDAELVFVTDRSLVSQDDFPSVFEGVRSIAEARGLRGARLLNQGGAAMNAIWVLEHAPALYFKLPKPELGGGSLWDFAATACLFAELGLPASDIAGRPLQLNREGDTFMNREGVLYASEPMLAAAVTERFGGARD